MDICEALVERRLAFKTGRVINMHKYTLALLSTTSCCHAFHAHVIPLHDLYFDYKICSVIMFFDDCSMPVCVCVGITVYWNLITVFSSSIATQLNLLARVYER